jgi:DNA repair protein RadC
VSDYDNISEQHGQYLNNEQILSSAIAIIRAKYPAGSDYFKDPKTAFTYLELHLGLHEREVFCCLFLDNRHRLIDYRELFFGTIDGASIHPREVIKEAMRLNAAAVIFGHNHPSGVSKPSKADITITRRLIEACAIVDVRVLDHIIVGEECVSMAELGLI